MNDIPYNKVYNRLRRGDELDVRRLGPASELKELEGGFSARNARLQRRSKSVRKASARRGLKRGRRMKTA